MMIDYTITIGNIIEIASIVGGGILVLMTLKGDVNSLKLGAASLKEDFGQMQSEIKKIGDVLITQADQNRRIAHLEEDFRMLRKGQGWIQNPARPSVDGEY